MKFQASFLENHINISTKECNRIFGLGRITFSIATGNYGALSILFPVHELDALRDKANSLFKSFAFRVRRAKTSYLPIINVRKNLVCAAAAFCPRKSYCQY